MIRWVKLGSHYWVYFSIVTMPIVESSHCNSFEERISVDSIWGVPWWRHQMESFSVLLAFCAGNSPVTGEFPSQRPVTRSFDIFFELCLNKRLCKQPWGWWCETLSCSLWRHRNASDLQTSCILDHVIGNQGSSPIDADVAYQCLSPALFDLKILIEKKSPYCSKPHIPCGAM